MSDKSTDIAPAEQQYKCGEYNGSGLKHSRPEVYTEICKLLADPSNSIKSISDSTGVSRQTVSGIMQHQTKDVTAYRERLTEVFKHITQAASDRVIERLQDPDSDDNLMQLDNALGVAFDKLRLLQGESTSNIDMRVQSVPSHRQFAAELEAAGVSVDAEQEDSNQQEPDPDSNEQPQEANPWD